MDVIREILTQLPPFWPRLAILIAIGLLILLPGSRHRLMHIMFGGKEVSKAMRLLQLRKLELDIAIAREAHPQIDDSVLDEQIRSALHGKEAIERPEPDPLSWRESLARSAIGAFGCLLLGSIVSLASGRHGGGEVARVAVDDLVLIVPCALIASLIPANRRWAPVFYGALLPILVVMIAVTAGHHD